MYLLFHNRGTAARSISDLRRCPVGWQAIPLSRQIWYFASVMMQTLRLPQFRIVTAYSGNRAFSCEVPAPAPAG